MSRQQRGAGQIKIGQLVCLSATRQFHSGCSLDFLSSSGGGSSSGAGSCATGESELMSLFVGQLASLADSAPLPLAYECALGMMM